MMPIPVTIMLKPKFMDVIVRAAVHNVLAVIGCPTVIVRAACGYRSVCLVDDIKVIPGVLIVREPEPMNRIIRCAENDMLGCNIS